MTPYEQFCPNEACEARGKIGAGNIWCHSQKDQRYKCKVCDKTFTATAGTPLYRVKASHKRFVIVVTLLAIWVSGASGGHGLWVGCTDGESMVG